MLCDEKKNWLTTTLYCSSGLEGAVNDGLKKRFWGIFLNHQSFSELTTKESNYKISYATFPYLLQRIGAFFGELIRCGDINDLVFKTIIYILYDN